MWVEVNNRVNYPIKEILGQMLHRGDLSLDDDACKYCISWLTINVATVGVSLFVTSWNEHPIPGIMCIPWIRLFMVCAMNQDLVSS